MTKDKLELDQDELEAALINVEKRSTSILHQLELTLDMLTVLHSRLGDIVTWLKMLVTFGFSKNNDQPKPKTPPDPEADKEHTT